MMGEASDNSMGTAAAGRFSHVTAVLIIALYALPLLLVHLGTGDANDMMEMFNLVPVKEAYRDGHWLVPTLNGEPRLEKPPLPVWLPAGLAKVVGSDSLWVVRLPSVLAALLTCLAVYGIACLTTKDRMLGLYSAIVLASMVVFLRQARIASYDIFATAFTTFGLMGLVGMMEAARRRWAWAVLAGAALALANLSKGPVPPATVCLPFGLWMILYHRKSWRAWGLLGLALVVCVLVTAPPLLATEWSVPGAHKKWVAEFLQFSAATGAEYQTSKWYYVGILGWVVPWTALLVGGLVMPWMKGSASASSAAPSDLERRTRWLFWLVLVLGAVILTVPTEKKPRYCLQLFPAAALLCGAVWQQFARVKTEARIKGAGAILLAAQPLIVWGMGVGIFLSLLVTYVWPGVTTDVGWLPKKAAAAVAEIPATLRPGLDFLGGPWVWVGIAVVLLVLALAVGRLQGQRRFGAAFACFAAATWVLLLSFNWVYRGENFYHADPYRADAEKMVALAGSGPVYTLKGIYSPWLHVVFYANQILPQKEVGELAELAGRTKGPLWVLAPTKGGKADDPTCPRATAAMAELQEKSGRKAAPVFSFSDEHYMLTLYRLEAEGR
jgi:4-amino-4-deoxy-L-arabinose transferase-like glycosyltransferase